MDNITYGESILTVRPYQLLCLFCAHGDEEGAPCGAKLDNLLEHIRQDPGVPLALRCHSDDSFGFQSPGRNEDTLEGTDFNQKRDMEILFRMDLTPGAVLPARIALARALKAIPSVTGICGFGDATAPTWQGCRFAESGRYERVREEGVAALIPPRDQEAMEHDKAASLEAMFSGGPIRIRPHILLCAVAQYGRGVRPPFDEDNLPELLQHVLKEPKLPIMLVGGADAMMCAPCPSRCESRGTCMGPGFVNSGGLFNELKDLRILQIIGKSFDSVSSANELFTLILTRIPMTVGACALERSVPELSVWWEPCPCAGYEKGRKELMSAMGII